MNKETKNEITIKPWIKRGGMLYNTECLDPEDPDHIYNQAKAQGVEPEDFGIPNPLEKEYHQYSKEELVEIIIDLKNKIKSNKLLDTFNDDFDYE
jgi:hypothetical protein